jgi:hypothetical protein
MPGPCRIVVPSPRTRKRSRRRNDIVLEVLAVAAALASLAASGPADPFAGVWKLNLEKSALAPPAPRSVVGHIECDGRTISERVEVIDAEGRASTASVKAAFDGQFYPLVGSPLADAVRYERLDARTIRGTSRKDGKILVTELVVLSEDGRTMTVTYSGIDAQGRTVTGTSVFEKQ